MFMCEDNLFLYPPGPGILNRDHADRIQAQARMMTPACSFRRGAGRGPTRHLNGRSSAASMALTERCACSARQRIHTEGHTADADTACDQ